MSEYKYIHHIPGRLRLELAQIRRDSGRTQEVQRGYLGQCQQCDGQLVDSLQYVTGRREGDRACDDDKRIVAGQDEG